MFSSTQNHCLIVTTIDTELTGITNRLGILGKSFATIMRDLRSGQGIVTSVFRKSVTKSDVEYITSFMTQIKAGVPTVQAYANTLANASVAGKQMAGSARTDATSLQSLIRLSQG